MRVEIPNGWEPRDYQHPLWDYLMGGGREAVAIWHRRAGKDEVGLHATCVAAHRKIATYWHMLPEATQARKAIWDAINPKTGKRRIDEAFPRELRETTRDHEMFIKFKCGSTWQVVGSDNYNSLVGSPPAGIVYSEWAIANPSARAYLRPIIAENNGWELFITTPRGRNHALGTYKSAQSNPGSFAQVLTAEQSGAITAELLESERQAYIKEYGVHEGEAFWRQEYMCDFNAANMGAILGRYITDADNDGRIGELDYDPDGAPIEISCDIGFRDTTAWWFWQPRTDGFGLFDYDADSGLNAAEWIDRLKDRIGKRKLAKIWLPHDAKAKTFSAQRSAVEQFVNAFGVEHVGIVPDAKKADRINAARSIMPRCYFSEEMCEEGLDALREWSYEWNDDLKVFGKEPRHDWASHPGDAFSYGALIMCERVIEQKATPKLRGLTAIQTEVTLDEMWEMHQRSQGARARI